MKSTTLFVLCLIGSFLSGYLFGGLHEKSKTPAYISVDNFIKELTTDSVHPSMLWGYKTKDSIPVLGFVPEPTKISLTTTGTNGPPPINVTNKLNIPRYDSLPGGATIGGVVLDIPDYRPKK